MAPKPGRRSESKGGYELVVSPNSPVVSVGATIHFVLRPTNFATEVIDMTETVDWGGSATDIHWEWQEKPDHGGGAEPRRTLHVKAKLHTFEAPSGTVSHSVTWDKPGEWTVIARVQRTGVIYQCELSVLPRSEIIGWSKAWPENQADPHAAAQWGRQTLELMDELVRARPAMDEATARRHASQRLQLRQYLDGLDKLLVGVPHSQLSFIRGVWVARTVDDVADDVVGVRVILYKTVHPGQRPRWHLVDWTNPTSSRALAVHVGQMMDDASSIKAAIASWETSNQYPAGTIEFEVDGMAGYHLVRAYDDPAARNLTITTTEDFALVAADILGWLSMGTFVLSLVAIATGIGSVAAPALLAVSAAAGASSGAAHIVYLINAGSENWRAYALDALSIAGNILGLRGGAFKLMGTAPIKIGAAKTTKYVVMGEMMTNGAELVLVAESTHTQLGKLADDPSKTAQEKLEQATTLVGVAIGTSALLVWSVRQNATDLKNIDNFLKSAIDPDPSWRGHIEGGKDPGEVQDVVVHNAKRVPDQALLYRDVRELRVGAGHAVDVVHGSARGGAGLVDWVEGTHWKAWKGRKGKSGAAGVLQLPDGRVVPGRSDRVMRRALDRRMAAAGSDSAGLYEHVRNPELREALVSVAKRGDAHGGCAEVFMLDDALDLVDAAELRGATADTRVSNLAPVDVDSAAGLPACKSCQHTLARFGVVDINSIRRGNQKVSSTTLKNYLARLGYPRSWIRADDAIRQLTIAGFPVSPAAQEMIRRYGGLDSIVNVAPEQPSTGKAQNGQVSFRLIPPNVLSTLDVAKELEEDIDMDVGGLCALGYTTIGGILCIDTQGTVWNSETPWGYAGATPHEVIERLLEGRPNKAWWTDTL